MLDMGKCINLFTLNGFNLNQRGLTDIYIYIYMVKTLRQQSAVNGRAAILDTIYTGLNDQA